MAIFTFKLTGKSTVQRKSIVKKNESAGTPAAYEDSTQRAFKAFEKKLDDTKEVISQWELDLVLCFVQIFF